MGLTFRPVAARSFWAQPVLLDEFRGLAQPSPARGQPRPCTPLVTGLISITSR